jgi:DNA-binding FadR family transcriptional regulator
VIAAQVDQVAPGPRAIEATPETLIHLLEARLLIEPHVVALAALQPDPDAVEYASALIQGMQLAADDPALHAVTDLRVHRAIVQICRNPLMVDAALRLLDMAGGPVLQQARIRAWSDPDLPRLWTDHHEQVLSAIRQRDPERAAAAAWQHLRSVSANVAEALATGDSAETFDPDTYAHARAFIQWTTSAFAPTTAADDRVPTDGRGSPRSAKSGSGDHAVTTRPKTP